MIFSETAAVVPLVVYHAKAITREGGDKGGRETERKGSVRR